MRAVPCNKAVRATASGYFAARGYVVVIEDLRGRPRCHP